MSTYLFLSWCAVFVLVLIEMGSAIPPMLTVGTMAMLAGAYMGYYMRGHRGD